jgi:hypothetical protein
MATKENYGADQLAKYDSDDEEVAVDEKTNKQSTSEPKKYVPSSQMQ